MSSDQDWMPFLKAIFHQTQDSRLSTEANGLSSVVLSYAEKKGKVLIQFQMLFISLALQLVLHKLLFLSHDRFIHLLKYADESSDFTLVQNFDRQHSENDSSKPRQHSCPAHQEKQGSC